MNNRTGQSGIIMFTKELTHNGTGTATRRIFSILFLSADIGFSRTSLPFVAVNNKSFIQPGISAFERIDVLRYIIPVYIKRRSVGITEHIHIIQCRTATTIPAGRLHKIKVSIPNIRASISYTRRYQHFTVSSFIPCILKILPVIPCLNQLVVIRTRVVRLFEFFTGIHNILPALIGFISIPNHQVRTGFAIQIRLVVIKQRTSRK